MLYLGIDQHRKQLTVSLRNEEGDVILRRQVSTQWVRVRAFFEELRERSAGQGGFAVVLEVCGFNDWLLKLLGEYGGVHTILAQPEFRSRQKTDRRDAHKLSEILWINRQRLLGGERVQGIRRITPPTPRDAENRQLTALRKRLGQQRTRTINKVQRILLRHNLQQECPTKGIQTRKARQWLRELPLEAIDRLELNGLLDAWQLCELQLADVEAQIAERQPQDPQAVIVASIPGAGAYSSLGLASRVGDIARFPKPASLVNYWGLAPTSRNSGEQTQRLGSISKQGSAIARFLLGQMVLHVLKRDPRMKQWYRRIKRRRGSKIARVAVMRRLTTIIWHMLKRRTPYCSDPAQLAAAGPRQAEAVCGEVRRAAPRGSSLGLEGVPVATAAADAGGPGRTSAGGPCDAS